MSKPVAAWAPRAAVCEKKKKIDEIFANFEIRAAQNCANLVDTFGILFFFSQGALRGL